jgi:acetyl esterase/lipase
MPSLREILLLPISKLFSGNNRIDDIAYGSEPLMTYDEYPSNNKTAPLVIYWYGGSWKNGSKNNYRFIGHKLRSMGAHVFIVDYPKYPKRVFPGFTEDALAAVNHIKNRYPDRKVVLMGHSAGANTAMLLGLRQKAVADKVVSVAGVCTLSNRVWHPVFGDAIKKGLHDPRNYTSNSNKTTEFLLFHGRADPIVLARDSISLQEKLISSGHKSQLILVRCAGHGSMLMLLIIGPLFKSRRRLKHFIFS